MVDAGYRRTWKRWRRTQLFLLLLGLDNSVLNTWDMLRSFGALVLLLGDLQARSRQFVVVIKSQTWRRSAEMLRGTAYVSNI